MAHPTARQLVVSSVYLATLVATVSALSAKPLLNVPGDVATLQEAIDQIDDQGIIEMAGGVYSAPDGGFRVLTSNRKSFTVRARAGEDVVLDGRGTTPILRIQGEGSGLGRRVAVEGLTFRDGLGTEPIHGGAVSVDQAEAEFISCTFDNNRAENGGGAFVRRGSYARFVNTLFENNSARVFGGGIRADDSRVDVVWSRFLGNRVNLPGHDIRAIGGAIRVKDTDLTVDSSLFEDNEAAQSGGAITATGSWPETSSDGSARMPAGEPFTVRISRSAFRNNRTFVQNNITLLAPATGGAVHVEDAGKFTILSCQFFDNESTWGGGVAGYRTDLEIEDTVFSGNRASDAQPGEKAIGGTINVSSSDFSDLSTDFGKYNRPSARLTMRNTLVRGRSVTKGRNGPVGETAENGGCLRAGGDIARQTGTGVPQDGTAEQNRAKVELDGVVFFDCDATDRGGAMSLVFTDLHMTSSMVLNSDAQDAGGGVNAENDNHMVITDTVFAGNSADRGGAMRLSGNTLEISDSFFLDNSSTDSSRASAIDIGPHSSGNIDISGVVRDSVFSGNTGFEIQDTESKAGPFNFVHYDRNEFFPAGPVYKITTSSNSTMTVSQLNNLTVFRSGALNTKKSEEPNKQLSSLPRHGFLLPVPSAVRSNGPPGDSAPPEAFLGYAWSGTSADINGNGLSDTSGILDGVEPGTYRIRVNGQNQDTAKVDAAECSGGTLSCLSQDRFLIEVDWRDFNDRVGPGTVVPGGSDDSGLFWFFDQENWEMLVKVLDKCGGKANRFWVFSAATTNVEYTLRVTDTVTGATKRYFNEKGAPAAAITDTTAFATCDDSLIAHDRFRSHAPWATWARAPRAAAVPVPRNGCDDTDDTLCLNQSRFQVEVEWRNVNDDTGIGTVVPLRSDGSGLFWFFDEENWEMLVKVLDKCGGKSNKFWVLSAATTDVEFTLRVTDTSTGKVNEYPNKLGTAAPATIDTSAFACP